jgi:hypothetical protein
MERIYIWLLTAFCLLIIAGGIYFQFRVIYDCGFMGLFHGSEWWWLFGYCK